MIFLTMTQQTETRQTQLMMASRAMGDKLLSGWTMLQETCTQSTCPGTPLMRDPKTGEHLCVTCGTSGGQVVSYHSPTHSAVEEEEEEELPTTHAYAEQRAQSDLASKRIGEKLLQGYAMLQQHCINDACFAVILVYEASSG
jgi:uncharacterized Zn finger protein (UPF0148 family)